MVPFRGDRSHSPRERSNWNQLLRAYLRSRRKKGGSDFEEGGVPVEPNRPNDLKGGAAAALEFDD